VPIAFRCATDPIRDDIEADMPEIDPARSDQASARASLRRCRLLATSLLVGMGGITAVGYALPARGIVADGLWFEMLRAGGRAGLVGGIADWFAVTALFRNPMGLPIPHTAILRRQKDRLGDALGRFVAGQFFTEADVERALASVDAPGMIARALGQPSALQTVSRTIRDALPPVFERIEDGRVSAAISRALPQFMGGDDLAPLIARALRALVESDYHQEVLSFLLERIKDGVREKDATLRALIADRVREQGGRFLGWAIGGSIASKVLHALNQELDRVDPLDSALREGFSEWARGEIDRIEHDAERRGEIARAIGGVLTHDSLRAWSLDVWRRARTMAEADMRQEDGWTASAIEVLLTRLVEQLQTDTALRARLDRGIASLVIASLPAARVRLAGFIASVVARWDGAAFVERIELKVGRDLQFIRINGTIVGFLAGIVLEGVLRGVFGMRY